MGEEEQDGASREFTGLTKPTNAIGYDERLDLSLSCYTGCTQGKFYTILRLTKIYPLPRIYCARLGYAASWR